MIIEDEEHNFSLFRECLSGTLVENLATKNPSKLKKKAAKGRDSRNTVEVPEKKREEDNDDVEDLAEFLDVDARNSSFSWPYSLTTLQYIATELFTSFPADLRTLSYSRTQQDCNVSEAYNDPLPMSTADALLRVIPPSVSDSLEAYAILPSLADLPRLLLAIIQEYVKVARSPPPALSATRASACEICDRSWIPLTYHHLIPKQMHAKAFKRGWHEQWRLNSVAWLCRACHSFVHRMASNEELAKELWTVERLMEREDLQAWAKWIARVRWKSR